MKVGENMRMEIRNKSLDKLYKRRTRIDIPEYQREKVWSLKDKQKLIDSLLRGWHIPKLFFKTVDQTEQAFEVVDGQQRLNAVFEFYDGTLSLPESATKEYGGRKYNELSPEYSDRFDDYEFQIEEIEDATDEELEELFTRLQLGKPLNSAEKLNAIGGDLRNYIKELTGHKFFLEAISVPNTRYAFFVICSRFVYLTLYGTPARLRQGELEKMLCDNKNFSKSSSLAKKVSQNLDALHLIFAEKPKLLRNRANILSCYLLVNQFDHKTLKENIKYFKDFFSRFFELLDTETEKGKLSKNKEIISYQDAISRNTDSREAISVRQQILLGYLAKFQPILYSQISNGNNYNEVLAQVSTEIKDLLLRLNKSKLGVLGEDAIKMTSTNLETIDKLSSPVDDEKSFGEMIDNLYKLLYEGSGNCQRTTFSEIIDDLKILRTDIRHDWDHGAKKVIKKKSNMIANVYSKYTGKKSLPLFDEKDFEKIQLLIYTKVKDYLSDELGSDAVIAK